MNYSLASDFASRKRKRRRRRPAKRSVDEDTKSEQASCKLYFDNIPDNALENVVRYLSVSPRARSWPSHLPVEVLTRMYRVRGYMGEFCRTRFSTLCVSDVKCIYNLDKDIWDKRAQEMLWAPRKLGAHDVVLHGGGCLKTLFIGPDYARQIHNADMLDDFSRKCTGLTALSIESDGRAWIERFGDRLECLELGLDPSRSAFFAIQNYCTNLRELTLNAVHRTDVARTAMWEKIGVTLEILDVAFHFPCAGEIAKIEQHCRKLRHVHVEEGEAINTALAQCLASYGTQLEFATLSDMNEHQLKQVTAACPNAKFSMFVEEGDLKMPLSILGAQLEKAFIEFNGFTDDDALGAAWDTCENLRQLHVLSDCTHADMRRLFKRAKTELQIVNLYIADTHSGETTKEIIDTVARGTGALENVQLQCSDPPVGAFDALVERNKHALQNVHLTVHGKMGDDAACDVAEKFLQAPNLVELDVEDAVRRRRNFIQGVQDICRSYMYRHRRVCVHMLNYPYLR